MTGHVESGPFAIPEEMSSGGLSLGLAEDRPRIECASNLLKASSLAWSEAAGEKSVV